MALVCNTEIKAQTKQKYKDQMQNLKRQYRLKSKKMDKTCKGMNTGDLKEMMLKMHCASIADSLIKKGWKTLGLDSIIDYQLHEQLYELYAKMNEKNADGTKRYIIIDTAIITNTFSAGQMKLNNIAALRIAEKIKTMFIDAIVDYKIPQKEAIHIINVIENTYLILGYISKEAELFRYTKTDNIELRGIFAYDTKNALSLQYKVLIAELEKMEMDNDLLEKCKIYVNNICYPSRIPDEIPADQILD
jgi:hypothetical protein